MNKEYSQTKIRMKTENAFICKPSSIEFPERIS